MTTEQLFRKIPKAVLFEIALQFGMRIGDDFTAEGAVKAILNEWFILHAQQLVETPPPK